MEPQFAIDLTRQAMMTALLMGAPILIAGVAVGLLIGLLQAVTQIQDQTVSFVPKIIAMAAVLTLFFPWLLQIMIEYSQSLYTSNPEQLLGG